ncbi:hypothetical protein [Corynebacterium doosanense]|uniref:hypothetical protein n=1 Tax=Corynebacterium doosanense TaxID=1121358 RepID=UPI0012E02773|nr:hypothetical protein [Corynebacterium doosanense]
MTNNCHLNVQQTPIFTGHLTASAWPTEQTAEFRLAVTWGGIALTVLAAGLVAFGMLRAHGEKSAPEI